MQIDVKQLLQVSKKLFAHLESFGIKSVQLPVDYYWEIPKEKRYTVSQEPSAFTIGQLQSDWAELQKVLNGDSDPLAYHFVWLAALLRAAGEEIVR